MRKNILTAATLLFAAALLTASYSAAQTKSKIKTSSAAIESTEAIIRPSGRYKITVFLPDSLLDHKVVRGEKFYLRKQTWSDASSVIIDSALVSDKNALTFIGGTYKLSGGKENSFTAGCYEIWRCGGDRVCCIFYSSEEGEKFTETYRVQKRKNPWLQDVVEIKGGSENEIYLRLQNYSNLMLMLCPNNSAKGNAADTEIKKIGADSLSHVIPNLKFLAGKACPNSLVNILLSYGIGKLPENFDGTGPLPFADDRMIYTNYGERILKNYLYGLQYNPKDTICVRLDKLLNNRYLTSDKLKAAIALSCFNFFKNADVMGTESGAIHIGQKYILNKKIAVPDSTFFEVQYYTKLNENTQLGMKAPALELKDTSGVAKSISSAVGEYTIMYFYSDDCAYCKIETPKLVNFINTYTDTPLNVYAVYTGTDIAAWKKYLSNFSSVNPFVNWIHVADLARESDFPLIYGVISTPTMYLLNRDGKVIGRGVKTDEIKDILQGEKKKRDGYDAFFERMLKQMNPVSAQNVETMIDMLYNQLTGEKDTTTVEGGKSAIKMSPERKDLYCDIFRELYVDFKSSDDYAVQEGAAYAGEKYICGKSELWEDKTFVESVGRAIKAFNKNKLGGKAADVRLRDISGTSVNLYDIHKEYKVLYFYNPTCGICKETSKQMKKIYSTLRNNVRAKKSKFGVEFLGIYTGADYSAWVSYVAKNGFEWRNLWDKDGDGGLRNLYDVENVPGIYLLDKDNTVIAKDITPETLQKLLDRL
jgi:peroxiredoxin